MDSITQTGLRFPSVSSTPAAKAAAFEPAVQRLIAARVGGDPIAALRDASQPPSDPSMFAMYRHPADKNTAATAVQAGRTLDVQA